MFGTVGMEGGEGRFFEQNDSRPIAGDEPFSFLGEDNLSRSLIESSTS